MCFVKRARSILLLSSGTITSSQYNVDEDTYEDLSHVDRHNTVTSLNLHMILGDNENNTFTTVELRNDANVNFLRPIFLMSKENDWPLTAAGSVLCHSAIDSLIVANMFSPNLIGFWETLMVSNFNDITISNNGRNVEIFITP
jgi:hypothetical protein